MFSCTESSLDNKANKNLIRPTRSRKGECNIYIYIYCRSYCCTSWQGPSSLALFCILQSSGVVLQGRTCFGSQSLHVGDLLPTQSYPYLQEVLYRLPCVVRSVSGGTRLMVDLPSVLFLVPEDDWPLCSWSRKHCLARRCGCGCCTRPFVRSCRIWCRCRPRCIPNSRTLALLSGLGPRSRRA